MKSETLSLRPYARLLTMLGDQLIKNERIAVVELIKNAYDADAGRVEVRFENFDEKGRPNRGAWIVVRDDGIGMTAETVRGEWMNPASPAKLLAKRAGRGKTPGKNRIIQGDKGIGRFAVLKLGRNVMISTRLPDADQETVLAWDFSRYDDDFVMADGERKKIFLDEIRVEMSQVSPKKLRGGEHGTVIEIRHLKGTWGRKAIELLCSDVANLTDPVSRITRRKADDRFEIAVVFNGEHLPTVEEERAETLRALIEDKAVLKIGGRFDEARDSFVYRDGPDGSESEINLDAASIRGLWVWRRRCRKSTGTAEQLTLPVPAGIEIDSGTTVAGRAKQFACGSFAFNFYIFDFSRGIERRYALNQTEKNLLKSHRIYLYRDEVRVYPYGDPDDDWLNIDVTRGTGRAGNFFSNDQTIGWINISQKDNPDLRDKTNREGLIETGGAADDLIFLVQVFLSYIKQHPFARYQHGQRRRSTARLVHDGPVAGHLAELKKDLENAGHGARARDVGKIKTEYEREKQYLTRRAEMTEDLAGVGLSVEMASHDIMLLMTRAGDIGRRLARAARSAGNDEVLERTDMLIGVLQQITHGMRDVQIMFKSSRRRRKSQKIEPILDQIHQIYRALLDRRNVRYRKVTVGLSPLVANTTDGVVMQVLINLFDNASYWLETVDPASREIRVTVDGDRGELLFSDSGPGVDPEDLPYIFEPFYSGKGQEGRGLGLYIARQLLDRHDYRIAVADKDHRSLPGANFVIGFVREDS